MKIKQFVAILVLFSLLTAIFASCKTDGKTSGEAVKDTTVGEKTDAADVRIMPNLPDMDFGGKVYKIVGLDHGTYDFFRNFEIDSESITGDIVPDAIYNRNRRLEAKYNVKISQELVEDVPGLLKKMVQSGDDLYDLALIRQNTAGAAMTAGLFCDLKKIEHLDFEKPWWSEKINKTLSVNNKLFATTSDFQLLDKERSYLIMFNKEMAKSYNMGNLYDLVYSGKWTIEKMAELCRMAVKELDGDGAMTPADQWGLGMTSVAFILTFFTSCGNYTVAKDESDTPKLSINNERAISSIDRILKLSNDKTMSFYCEDFEGKVPYDYWASAATVFEDGRSLFIGGMVQGAKHFTQSSAAFDFGVLPIPKYDENQDDYITRPDEFGSIMGVPATVQDTDFSGFMLEALSAASKYEVLPVYYEIATKTKYTTDEDSQKMIDIIFSGIRYDLGFMYNWGGNMTIFYLMGWSGKNTIASEYEKSEAKIKKEMEKTIDKFNDLP